MSGLNNPKIPQPKITVTGRIPDAGLDLLRSIDGSDVWAWMDDAVIPTEVRNEQLADADAAVTLLTDRVDDDFLAAAPKLQIVANVAVGYNNIDVDACTRRGVIVTNTPGVLIDATADLAMGLVLMSTRRLGEGERLIRSGTAWQWSMFMMLGTGLQGRTLGIVGMGGIGEALATRARAFGMRIVYHNRRNVDTEVEQRLDAQRVDFDELLATSDIVSLNCPYSEATHHLIDASALAAMKSTAFLVNTARGPIVDEAALVEALVNGVIAGAALDVFENEPTVHPGLLSLDNVVLVPHLGSATVETRAAMATAAASNVVEVLAGRTPHNPVSG
ncbi:MAG: D-glycerate dehydrogenase [Ilumatobacter sp.]|uniref:2-hydroxyacid dehydrogenase n=1 Tax=Ilumatobacter sp. TaxID=1967498 RepID=UPI001DEE7201|nr:D-glycerate dehydrogenase [Ilumatobacter sp.]MBT5277682.1 D-glycerate dehydrogenase [Ilumatobacter sp.]MBT5865793.1 D-glycerate dehydrogenase [Ilumatobacter sp.]MDG0976852.1 D-glycerate dehydrogenase [Ilumatobacter sp.]